MDELMANNSKSYSRMLHKQCVCLKFRNDIYNTIIEVFGDSLQGPAFWLAGLLYSSF